MGRKGDVPAASGGYGLLELDQRLGLAVYRQAQGAGQLKLLAAVISFLIDEALWLAVPGFCASVLCGLRCAATAAVQWELRAHAGAVTDYCGRAGRVRWR